jgi:hypothetical protein
MEFHIMAIKKSSGSGIPSGNNAGRPANPGIGQLYSNGESARLELYTQASGWQNIIQETPGVSSITGNYLESTNSGTIIISGTNFVSGAYATAIGTNGVQVEATSTTFNSLVQITATFTGLVSANEPYDIKVTNPSNLFGMLPDALYVNNNPSWTTPAGSLGTFAEQVSATISALSVSDDSTITYSLAAGSSLPSGVTLSSAGVISGTLPDISSDTTYTFTVNATDGLNPVISRTFSFVSNAAPIWVTSAGSLGTYTGNTTISTPALSVTDTDSVTYTIASGSALPSGLALNQNTGVISGTLPVVSSSITYSFVINVNDGVNVVPRSLSITAQPAPSSIELLVVGGGGGGGAQVGGGGGAGGLSYGASYSVSPSTYLVTVGSGGSGSGQSPANPGNYGSPSYFGSIIANGGGGGGAHSSGNRPASGDDGITGGQGRPGGSGGGGGGDSSSVSRPGGSSNQASYSGVTSYGNNGGLGRAGNWAGGGGGGAGSAGSDSPSASTGGVGGNGREYSITGTAQFYAAGGGGCYNNSGGTTGRASGIGGAGNGDTPNADRDAVANTGSGGGGIRDIGNSGNGAAGVVIIAYPDTFAPIRTIPGTLTYNQPTRAGYRVYRFTAGSGTITF